MLIILNILTFLTGCGDSSQSENAQRLTYYSDGSESDFTDIIKRFNRYCESHDIEKKYRIEIINFESDEYAAKTNTEIMSGGGPDIMSLDQYLPFEKLIANDSLLDLNPILEADKSADRIDLSLYNANAMNAGVFDGKRLIIPISYVPNSLYAEKSVIEKFGLELKNKDKVSFKNVDEVFRSYFENPDGYSFLSAFENSADCYIFYLIYGSVDFENKETHFDTEDFRKALANIKLIKEHFGEIEFDGEFYIEPAYMLSAAATYENSGSPYFLTRYKSDTTILSGFSVNDNESTANFTNGLVLNKNTENPERILPFIKYILGENVQGNSTLGSYSMSVDLYSVPVSKIAFEENLKLAKEDTEDTAQANEDGDTVPFDINSDFMKAGIEISQNIDRFCIYLHPATSYFTSEVVYDLVLDYESGALSEDAFITKLTSAVNIYLKE